MRKSKVKYILVAAILFGFSLSSVAEDALPSSSIHNMQLAVDTAMKTKLEARLAELKAVYEADQKALAEYKTKMQDLADTLTRISSEIQVLEDEINSNEASSSDAAMKATLEARLAGLRADSEAGQKMLTEYESKTRDLADSLIRVSGAMQVLEDIINKNLS